MITQAQLSAHSLPPEAKVPFVIKGVLSTIDAEKCVEAGIGDIPMFVGGNIVVGKQNFEDVEKRFIKMGFNKAYPPGTPIEKTLPDIKEVLGE